MLLIKNLLPQRSSEMHKGDRGRLLVAGGSKHYPGAPALSCLSALRTGAGVVTLLSNNFACSACAAKFPEIVFRIEDDIEDAKSKWSDYVLSAKNNSHAMIAGMGLERSENAQEFIVKIWQDYPRKILIDGDGLFALAENQENLSLRRDSVITPHEGEAARLLRITPEEIHANREAAVVELARKWGCAVLKGHVTLIKSCDCDEIFRVIYGGAELSVPGSGDVLAGCIGAFLAMGLEPVKAAYLGASVHGMSGDLLRKKFGIDGVSASEIASNIRFVINNLRRNS